MRPNIRQIEAFNAVVKCGSVTRAAEDLFVSQPAVTKLIRAFEDACGFPLFIRESGRLRPTPEARRLYLETEKLLLGVAQIDRVAKSIRNLEEGEITVVGFPALSMRLLPKSCARFLAKRPQVRLSVMTRTSPSIPDGMLTGKADFGVSLLKTPGAGLECHPFGECSMVAALPADHPLTNKRAIHMSDLKTERLISLGRDDLSAQVIEQAYIQAKEEYSPAIQVQMADSACTFVAEGQGIALVPSLCTEGWSPTDVQFRPFLPAIKTPMWLYTSSSEPMSQLAKDLLAQIRSTVEAVEHRFAVVEETT